MSKGDLTRGRILEHALALASRLGLEGLTIGTLATATALTKSGVYAHFASKEALQVAVLDAAQERFLAEVVVPVLQGPRGVQRLRALFDAWLRWGLDGPLPGGCPFVAAAAEQDDRPGPVRDALAGHLGDLVGLFESAAAEAVREGAFRADLDVTGFAQHAWGLLVGCFHFARLLEVPDTDARARAAFERLLRDAAPAR